MLTVREAAQYVRRGESTVRNWIKTGRLYAHPTGVKRGNKPALLIHINDLIDCKP